MTEVINNKGIKNITKIFFKRSIKFLLQKKIKPGNYNLLNRVNFKVYNLIKKLNEKKKSNIKFQWISSAVIKEKIYKNKKLPLWNPRYSDVNNLVNFILEAN